MRSHVARPMDFRSWPNRILALEVGAFGAAALVMWVTGGPADVLWAPVQLFVVWGVVREIDPDHESTALVAGMVAGVWVLAGLPMVSALAGGAMLVATRLVTNTTGRRPLLTDLVVIALFAAGISFTDVGFVAGFGLAVAIYVDDRMTGRPTRRGVLTAVGAAVGAAVLASVTNAFPRQLPDVMPAVAAVAGALALAAAAREPELPMSVSDSRMKTPIAKPRLHVSRVLFAAILFASSILGGSDAGDLGPLLVGLAIALASNEMERIARAR